MNKYIGVLILAFFSFSCSSDLDFDQAYDVKLEPVIEANLATFEIQAHQFVVNGMEQNVAGDVLDLDVFNDDFFNENLTRADFDFEINNTINRAFRVSVYLLDDDDTILYTIPFNVPAYSGAVNTISKEEIFEKVKVNILKNTTKIAFVAALLPGPTLSENSLGSLKLRSSATIYLTVE
ncbi:hypothetical protein [Flavobacterium eburneipallidum]|uniref:hypothetical protein n=1 Tax=Flavobacterium eburneipallidum TaxID=3003263 RepID=UPI0024832CD9|nr:hypothetical protein [Flavobacterium eburneipallidum]